MPILEKAPRTIELIVYDKQTECGQVVESPSSLFEAKRKADEYAKNPEYSRIQVRVIFDDDDVRDWGEHVDGQWIQYPGVADFFRNREGSL